MRNHPVAIFLVGAALSLAACTSSRTELDRLPDTASRNAQLYAQECDDGEPGSCFALALIYQMGDEANAQGVPQDVEHAQGLFERACAAGHAPACDPPTDDSGAEPQ